MLRVEWLENNVIERMDSQRKFDKAIIKILDNSSLVKNIEKTDYPYIKAFVELKNTNKVLIPVESVNAITTSIVKKYKDCNILLVSHKPITYKPNFSKKGTLLGLSYENLQKLINLEKTQKENVSFILNNVDAIIDDKDFKELID